MIKMSDDEFKYFVDFIKSKYGINLINKRVLIEGRLNNYIVEKGLTNYSDYLSLVQKDKSGQELATLLNRITTNHTYFMRESEHFTYFQNTALPALEKNVRNKDLRVWCAAASTGEEPYTLAMILEDYFSNKPGWNKQMLASDLSTRALDVAKNGVYSEEAVKTLPAPWQQKYFAKAEENRYRVADKIKREVVYRTNNLMDPFAFKQPFHVIFCRNVMIYFDAPTKASLIERFYDVLAPGGYLFIGHTESIQKPTRFQYLMPSIYQRGYSH